MIDPKLQSLLRQGERAARLGKQQAAEVVFRQAVDAFPESAEAWLGLSQVSPSEQEREDAHRLAVQLDPAVVTRTAKPVPRTRKPSAAPSEDRPISSVTPVRHAPGETAPAVRETLSAASSRLEATSNAASEADPDQTLVCANHPNRQAPLRCNRCSKPICLRCAVRTPVGYRCKACVREQQEVYYSATRLDHVLVTLVTLLLATVGAYIIYGIGWLTIFVAPFAGMVVAETVRLAARRRRGKWIPFLVTTCLVVGGLAGTFLRLFGVIFFPAPISIFSLLWQGVFLVLAASSAYFRVR
jgi:hypothetical protein